MTAMKVREQKHLLLAVLLTAAACLFTEFASGVARAGGEPAKSQPNPSGDYYPQANPGCDCNRANNGGYYYYGYYYGPVQPYYGYSTYYGSDTSSIGPSFSTTNYGAAYYGTSPYSYGNGWGW